MKRNIVIATIAAAALVGGGTATALAVSGDDEAPAQRSSVQVQNDDGRDDAADDASDRADDASDKNDASDDRSDKAEDAAEAKAAKVTAADAITAALKERSGTAVGADLDSEGTNLVWEVDVLSSGNTWHTVQVDPGNGKVLGSHTEEDAEDAAQARAALKGSSVSAAEAAEAAGAKGTVTSVDLDDEGAARAWGVDTTGADGVESEWAVNLTTAKVTADRAADDSDDSDDSED